MTDDVEPSTRTSRFRRAVLAVVIVLLTGGLAWEGWYLYLQPATVASAERPVVSGQIAHRSAVASAATSTSEILSYGFEDFDAQIDDATTVMTEAFAADFRQTTDAVEDRFTDQRITQEVRVLDSAVVRASEEEVQALLFLDLYLARAGEGTSVTPYPALVTVIRSDGRWLVSDIETQ